MIAPSFWSMTHVRLFSPFFWSRPATWWIDWEFFGPFIFFLLIHGLTGWAWTACSILKNRVNTGRCKVRPWWPPHLRTWFKSETCSNSWFKFTTGNRRNKVSFNLGLGEIFTSAWLKICWTITVSLNRWNFWTVQCLSVRCVTKERCFKNQVFSKSQILVLI